MTTANEIILGALKRCGSYSPAEVLSAQDAADALETLNDMLDSWSTDEASVFASSESVFNFTPGQYQYTIGNYTAGTFTGTLISGSPTISNVTVPSNLIARGDLSDFSAQIPAGATVLSFNAGAGTVTMSANALSTVATPEVITYTIPGNFKATRPLRVTNAFTRITTQASGLDYPIQIISQDQYTQIGFKAIAAPWPISLWYNSTMPLGNLYFYQNPSQAGELHLLSDNILTRFDALTTDINLPQGYPRALKWLLAKELCAVNRYPITKTIQDAAKESWDFIKALNQVPVPVANYDTDIVFKDRTDAGWIMFGGFR